MSCFFFSDFSDRLCETFNSEERDQWKVQREIPSHSTDLDQAQKVREKNIKKNKEKDVHLHVFIEYVKLIVLFCFFSIKRELKVITHTKVKFLKSFTWFIGGGVPQIDMKPIQISLEVQVIL